MFESLVKNPEFKHSPVYIFCDGAKNPEHLAAVAETRAIAKEFAPDHAEIVERNENLGLATSIITGVTQLTTTYGRAIVVEDDLLFASSTLRYFNQALDAYANDSQVMHISGYMFPVKANLPELFFYREATCWGWATWKRAWDKFDPDSHSLLKKIQNRKMEDEFDIGNTMGFVGMLKAQCEGRVNSWAIRWYSSISLHNGLSLHPGRSFVSNEGFDGTGVHCSPTKEFDVTTHEQILTEFPRRFEINQDALRAMQQYRRLQNLKHQMRAGLLKRAVGRAKRIARRYLAKLRGDKVL